MTLKRDSIKSKIFEEGGGGLEGAGATFFRKFLFAHAALKALAAYMMKIAPSK